MSAFAQIGLTLALSAAHPTTPASFKNDLFLLGSWECTLDRPGQPRRLEQANYRLLLGGKWLGLRYRVFEAGKLVSETEAYEGFDPKLAKWVYTSFSSQGSYGTGYSDGWVGTRKIYRPAAGAIDQFVLTAIKVNDRQFTEQIDVPAGTSTKTVFFLNCSKR